MKIKMTRRKKLQRITDRARTTDIDQLTAHIYRLMRHDPDEVLTVRDDRDGVAYALPARDIVEAMVAGAVDRVVDLLIGADGRKRDQMIMTASDPTLNAARDAIGKRVMDDAGRDIADRIDREVKRRADRRAINQTRMQA